MSRVNPEQLRQAIADAGMTISGLASELGCDRTTIHRWLTGEQEPISGALADVARLTSKPMEYFFAVNVAFAQHEAPNDRPA